jgi:23S rRNA (guanosine2251-2'-O)-methyltransferase
MHRDRDREKKVYLYGKHALVEALAHAPRVLKKVFLAGDAGRDQELRNLLARANVPVAGLKGMEAERMVGEETAHQGVIAIMEPAQLVHAFREFVDRLDISERTLLVLLDELTDPQNVGAIIRSAAAFGAAGVLLPVRNQAGLTGAVVKASAGMVFQVPLVELGNVNQAVDALKVRGFRAYALAMQGGTMLANEPFDAPALVIVGNEGRGIRQKTFERADVSLRIPMDPKCESLNASVAAAIVLYEWAAKKRQ